MSFREALQMYLPEHGSYEPPDLAGLYDTLGAVLKRGYIDCEPDERRRITGAVSLLEATRIANIILERRCTRCAETGVAYGLSTAAICLALAKLGVRDAIHYGIDPCQWLEHKGAAVQLLKELGVSDHFELMEDPAHLGLAELIRRGVQLDFAFIDGWHTLDYKLIDFFLLDKLLVPGGIMAMHDGLLRSTRSVLTYGLAYRKYKLLPYPKGSATRTVLRLAHWFLGRANHPLYTLRRIPNLIILEKVSTWEPGHDYYRGI